MKHFWKFTVPAHVIGLGSLVYVLLTGQLAFLWAAVIAWALLSIGIEVGVHRLFSHKAFKTARWTELTLAYLGTLSGQGSIFFWVAIHRGYHHRYTDTDKDPHSPVNGLYQAYIGWLIDDTQTKVSFKSAADLMRDPALKLLHDYYYSVIFLTVLALGLIHPLLAGMYFLATALCIQQNFAVNVLCHLPAAGSRAHETKDLSRNVLWLAPLSWGLALHNNHHQRPAAWKLSERFGEIDPGSWVVRLLATEKK